MGVAIAILGLIVFSVLFHLLSPWWQTPLASNWTAIDNALNITIWITGAVFIAVNLFLAYAIIKYRHREGHKADYEPENAPLEKTLTLWTAVGIAFLLAPGLLAWHEYIEVPEDAAVMEAVGQQWSWSYRYPGADGVLGSTGIEHISADNPFGINPDDPYGRDDRLVTSNEMHLPVDQPVKVILRSKDVLHDFYVPQFRAKMDMVPGTVTYFWVTPTVNGTYEILCAELCGVGHHAMRGTVVVEDQADYDAWLADQLTFTEMMARNGMDSQDRQLAQVTGLPSGETGPSVGTENHISGGP